MLDELKDMISERLLLYKERNKSTLPERILVFRDGVSEVRPFSKVAELVKITFRL